jgi:hypothetical protein
MPDFPLQRNLAELKKILDSDPTSIEAANRYWSALASFGGNDVRSGGYAIEAFRASALASEEGTVALARAYQELFRKTGEVPRAVLFDEELRQTLRRRLSELSGEERGLVEWVLSFIK